MITARADGRPTISVVIPALNEEATILHCLRALLTASDTPDEIIVVDNGCVDDTVMLAQQSERVRVVPEPRPGVTFARTTGFDAAQGEIIARIDADSQVASDWLHRIRTLFHEESSLDGVGGGAAVAELSPRGKTWFSWWYRGFRTWHQRSIGVSPMLYGFNCAFRRGAWEQSRHLTGTGDQNVSDDVDVTIALLRSGHMLRHVPQLLVKARLFRSIDREKLRQYYRSDSVTLTRHQYGNRRRWVSSAGQSPPPALSSHRGASAPTGSEW